MEVPEKGRKTTAIKCKFHERHPLCRKGSLPAIWIWRIDIEGYLVLKKKFLKKLTQCAEMLTLIISVHHDSHALSWKPRNALEACEVGEALMYISKL